MSYMLHIPRPDGGYELKPVSLETVVEYLEATPLLDDLWTVLEEVTRLLNTHDAAHRIDVKIAAVETAVDGEEAAKLGEISKAP